MNEMPTEKMFDDIKKKIVNLRIKNQKNITVIKTNEMNGLVNLKLFRLTRCNLGRIEEGAFFDLKSLETLDLQANKLTYIPTALKSLEKLRLLNLGGNKIASTNLQYNFQYHQQLELLILRNNDLTEFPENLPVSLTKLSLGGNKISRMNTDLKHLSELAVLRLDGNKLTKIPIGKLTPAFLEELTLCNNEIDSSSVSSSYDLEGYENLKKLKLSGNKGIRYIGKTFLKSEGSTKLREIDFSNCSLEEIPESFFDCALDLQYIGLANNNLVHHNPDMFVYNRRLRKVALAGNPWMCDCMKVELSKLKEAVQVRIESFIKRQERRDVVINKTLNIYKFINDFEEICSEHSEDCGKVDYEEWNFKKTSELKKQKSHCEYSGFNTKKTTTTKKITTTKRPTTTRKTKATKIIRTTRPKTATTTELPKRVKSTTKETTTTELITTTIEPTKKEPISTAKSPVKVSTTRPTTTKKECNSHCVYDGKCHDGYWEDYCYITASEYKDCDLECNK